jgi:hypothetical protein
MKDVKYDEKQKRAKGFMMVNERVWKGKQKDDEKWKREWKRMMKIKREW